MIVCCGRLLDIEHGSPASLALVRVAVPRQERSLALSMCASPV
jgi:hypothetical protein